MEFYCYYFPQRSSFSPACCVRVTYADVKSFVIYPSAFSPKQDVTPNKQVARGFQTIQSPTAAEERTLQGKRQLKRLQSPQRVSVMLYMVNFLMNLLSYSFHPS